MTPIDSQADRVCSIPTRIGGSIESDLPTDTVGMVSVGKDKNQLAVAGRVVDLDV